MPTLADRFRTHVARRRLFPRPGTALVAVSGGPDSVALLDLLAGLAAELRIQLVVAHVDHGIQPGSAAVARSVHALAGRYGLPFTLAELHLGAASETAARRARYAWLRSERERLRAAWIVTAHHRDDQAETVLLRLLRGSAPAGLAGIPSRSRGGLLRPLLLFTRAELAAHVAARGLAVFDDPANADPRHLRSWVRHAVMPVLVQRLGPEVLDHLVRAGRHAARDRRAWEQVLDTLPDLDLRRSADGFDVARVPLRRYDAKLAEAVLRAAARRAGALVLGPRRARQIFALAARPSGRRISLGDGWIAEAAFDRLRVVRVSTAVGETSAPTVIQGRRGHTAFGEFDLQWAPATAPTRLARTDWRTWISGSEWEVRTPRRGDVVRPLGGVGRRPLRRLLMEARVPRSARSSYPVVARGETIVWVPGICRCAVDVPAPGTRAVRVDVTEHGHP